MSLFASLDKVVLKKVNAADKPIRYSVLEDREYWKDKNKIHQILPNMFLTSTIGASRLDEMKSLGVTHVFIPALVGIQDVKIRFPEHFVYKQLDLKDTTEENISKHFEIIFGWMDQVLANTNNKLLVHCARGASRSASFVIGYLMHSKGISYDEAFDYVTSIRPHVLPNPGFERQLREYFAKKYVEETTDSKDFVQELV